MFSGYDNLVLQAKFRINLVLQAKQETMTINIDKAYIVICIINNQRKVNLTKYGKIQSFRDLGPCNSKLSNTACFNFDLEWGTIRYDIALCPDYQGLSVFTKNVADRTSYRFGAIYPDMWPLSSTHWNLLLKKHLIRCNRIRNLN